MNGHLSTERLADLRHLHAAPRNGDPALTNAEVAELFAHIDAQADTIQRVRELACSWMLEQEEAEYTEPELLSLDTAAYEIIDALDGGQE